MSDVDKWLEEIANHDGTTLRIPSVRDLAQALLRARKVLATCADYENCVCHEPCPDEKGVRCLGGLLVEALADPELEELLR